MASSRYNGGEAAHVERHLFTERDNLLLKILMIRHNKTQKRLAIKKQAYETMEILEI